MKKQILAILAITLLSCTSQTDFKKGKSILESQGFTDIRNTGYNYFCCDEKDNFSTGFKAKDKNGNIVKGCICSGAFKGITLLRLCDGRQRRN